MNSLAAGLGAWWYKEKHVRVTCNLPVLLEAIKADTENTFILVRIPYKTKVLNYISTEKLFHCLGKAASVLTFLLWEMLRAPKSLNSEDVGEFTGSVGDQRV